MQRVLSIHVVHVIGSDETTARSCVVHVCVYLISGHEQNRGLKISVCYVLLEYEKELPPFRHTIGFNTKKYFCTTCYRGWRERKCFAHGVNFPIKKTHK